MSFTFGPLNKSIHTQSLELLAKLMLHQGDLFSFSVESSHDKNAYIVHHNDISIDVSHLIQKANLTHFSLNENDGKAYYDQKIQVMDTKDLDFTYNHDNKYCSLTHGEQIAIKDFTLGSNEVNDFLYQNIPTTGQVDSKAVQVTFLTSMMLASGLGKIKPNLNQEVLYRGESYIDSDLLERYILDVESEHTFTELNAFLSTSTDEFVAASFVGDMFVIYDEVSVTDVSGLSVHPLEDEAILNLEKIQWTSHETLEVPKLIVKTMTNPVTNEEIKLETIMPEGTHIFHAQVINPLVSTEDSYDDQALEMFSVLYDMANQKDIDLNFITSSNKSLINDGQELYQAHKTSEVPEAQSESASSMKEIDEYQLNERLVNNYPANFAHKAVLIDDNSAWVLALRHGEYSAQIDVAVGKIFQHFMPMSPDIHMVFDVQNNDYYVASEEIQHVGDFFVFPENASFIGFGKMSVLAYFIGETDYHSGNYLAQKISVNEYQAIKIDNAESLNPEVIQSPVCLEDILDNHWGLSFQVTDNVTYKNEQYDMIQLIAKTPFNTFASIISGTITSSPIDESLHFMNKMLDAGIFKDDLIQEQMVIDGIDTLNHALEKGPDGLKELQMLDLNQLLECMSHRHQSFKEIAIELEKQAEEVPMPTAHQITLDQTAIYQTETSLAEVLL